MVNKTWVIGDIHGEYEKFKIVLELVNFDFKNDILISLGDVVDRGYDSFACIELLLNVKNLISIRGNHDYEWYKFILNRKKDFMWNQGQVQTLDSYTRRGLDPIIHKEFFENQIDYYIDKNNNLFVHGGFNRHKEITDKVFNSRDVLLWDRDLLASARSYQSMKNNEYPFKIKDGFKEVFLGHTPTYYFSEEHKPLKFANINLLDTGSGKFKDGFVTIMNLETKEYRQA